MYNAESNSQTSVNGIREKEKIRKPERRPRSLHTFLTINSNYTAERTK